MHHLSCRSQYLMCRVERGAVPKRAELFAATCSNPSAKFEFLAFVGSNKKRTEMFSGAFGFSVSANDKFLLSMEFDFDPCSTALSGLIPGAAAFANQASESAENAVPKRFGTFISRFFELLTISRC
jgi:hypothetical protein